MGTFNIALGSFVTLALFFAGGWDELKRTFRTEWDSGVQARQQAAIQSLAGQDHREAVALLVQAAGSVERRVRELQARSEQIEKEMSRYPADQIVDRKGIIVKRDWYEKRLELDRQNKETAAEIARISGHFGSIAGVFAGFRSEDAIAAVVDEFEGRARPLFKESFVGAMGSLPGARVGEALAEAVTGKSVSLAALAVAALAERGEAADREVVIAALSSADWPVQRAACEGIIRLDALEAVEPLISGLEKQDGRMRQEFNRALVALTGEDRHGDVAAWRGWWSEHRETIALKRPTKEERHRALGDLDAGREAGTTFYGIPVTSKRVLFVLDRSGSMAATARWEVPQETPSGNGGVPEKVGDRKIDVCKYELCRAIRQLPDDARFNVIFYNRDAQLLNDRGLILANTENRRRAIEFIRGIEPSGATNVYDTVEQALAGGEVDTIFLLSDGMPTCGRFEDAKGVLTAIAECNRALGVVIHTIYTGEESAGRSLMEEIAKQNRGRFVDRSGRAK